MYTNAEDRVQTTVRLDRKLYALLRAALVIDELTFTEWMEIQAHRYVSVTMRDVTVDGPAVGGHTSIL
jgi:hypothetical protein